MECQTCRGHRRPGGTTLIQELRISAQQTGNAAFSTCTHCIPSPPAPLFDPILKTTSGATQTGPPAPRHKHQADRTSCCTGVKCQLQPRRISLRRRRAKERRCSNCPTAGAASKHRLLLLLQLPAQQAGQSVSGEWGYRDDGRVCG